MWLQKHLFSASAAAFPFVQTQRCTEGPDRSLPPTRRLSGSCPSPGHACCKRWGSQTWKWQCEDLGTTGEPWRQRFSFFTPKWRPFPLLPVIPLLRWSVTTQRTIIFTNPSQVQIVLKYLRYYSTAILTALKNSKILLIPSNLQQVSGGKKLRCIKMELGSISVVLWLINVQLFVSGCALLADDPIPNARQTDTSKRQNAEPSCKPSKPTCQLGQQHGSTSDGFQELCREQCSFSACMRRHVGKHSAWVTGEQFDWSKAPSTEAIQIK